ncbi:MAG: hypothetical protein J4F34_00310 [Gemmatimonadetes bacterium]|nr:hypothetical protein [Gemmatimonadota bacterium]
MVHGLLAALTAAVLAACQMFSPVDLDPDVVVLSLLLESGEGAALMLASHPHREWDGVPPEISASLEGPGWTAEFVDTGSGERCGDPHGLGPVTCLNASLPEAAGPGRYRLRGTTSRGSFTGAMTVPATPLMENPADTVRIPSPDTSELFPIPLHYQVDSATAALWLDAVVDGGYHLGMGWWELGDTLETDYRGIPYTLSLRVRAIGPNYADWFRHTGDELVLPPWPNFGIEGEGVYGYFDGISAPTPWVHIVVGER